MKECSKKGANANPYSATGDHIGEERPGGISNKQFRKAIDKGDYRIVQKALKSSAVYNIEHEVRYLRNIHYSELNFYITLAIF